MIQAYAGMCVRAGWCNDKRTRSALTPSSKTLDTLKAHSRMYGTVVTNSQNMLKTRTPTAANPTAHQRRHLLLGKRIPHSVRGHH